MAPGSVRNAGVRLRTILRANNAGVRLHAMWLSVKTRKEGGGDIGRMSPCVTPDRFPFRALSPTTTTSASLSSLSLFDSKQRLRVPPLLRGMWACFSIPDGGYIPRGGPVQWEAQQGE